MKLTKLLAILLGILVLSVMCGTSFAQEAPKSPIVLKSSALGAVKFDHTSHLKVAAKCEVCHHASRPERPLKSRGEACTDCHTTPPTPPVKINTQLAFHNASATAGLCIECHKAEDANGKAAPVRCADCHVKDSA